MENFTQNKNIEMKKILPLYPFINPVETLMHQLGKTMKNAHLHHQPENGALESFLKNYRYPTSSNRCLPSSDDV